MPEIIAYKFELRWLCFAFATVLALVWLYAYNPYYHFSGSQKWRSLVEQWWVSYSRLLEKKFFSCLALLGVTYTLLAFGAKFWQYKALALNAYDFWLFEDMLQHLLRGAPFLTRFAPQASGWLQHGVVHQFFSWYLAVPLAWLSSSLLASLLYGPLVMSGAGMVVALLAYPRWGKPAAWLLALAFLGSSYVNKTVMYDVHPESAYPLFILLWGYGAGLGERAARQGHHKFISWSMFLLGLVGGLLLKEDAFLVFLPLGGALFIWEREQRVKAVVTMLLTVVVMVFNWYLVRQWRTGAWGPAVWDGARVALPTGLGYLRGHHWDSWSSVVQILQVLLQESGGVTGALLKIGRFFVSRPWLSLLFIFPWVVRWPFFWSTTFLIGSAYALLGGLMSKLVLYYVAPFIGLLWLAALYQAARAPSSPTRKQLLWIVLCCLGLGRGGLIFVKPSAFVSELQQEASKLAPCLGGKAPKTLVATQFLGLVPREAIWTMKVPAQAEDWLKLEYVFFAPKVPSYEAPLADLKRLQQVVSESPEWVRLGETCQPVAKSPPGLVELYAWNPRASR